MDYTASVPRIRQYFLKFARSHPLYDGRHCALLVTDSSVSTITLTCQISVANAMDVIQVTSDIREAMVEFIAKKATISTIPEVKVSADSTQNNPSPSKTITTATSPPADKTTPTLALLGLDWSGHGKKSPETHHTLPGEGGVVGGGSPPSPPLPPLTKEDEKMGEGSRMYQTYSSVSSNEIVAKTAGGSFREKSIDPSATSTAVSSTGSKDHVQVDVDGSEQNMPTSGLTRRSIRDTDPREAVVPTIVTEK